MKILLPFILVSAIAFSQNSYEKVKKNPIIQNILNISNKNEAVYIKFSDGESYKLNKPKLSPTTSSDGANSGYAKLEFYKDGRQEVRYISVDQRNQITWSKTGLGFSAYTVIGAEDSPPATVKPVNCEYTGQVSIADGMPYMEGGTCGEPKLCIGAASCRMNDGSNQDSFAYCYANSNGTCPTATECATSSDYSSKPAQVQSKSSLGRRSKENSRKAQRQ